MLSCQGNQGDLPVHVRYLDNLVLLTDQELESYEFQFQREMVFSDSLLLDAISDIAVDDNGRVYLSGSGWNRRQIHIFNEDGSYLDSLGQYGTNLGEFMEIDRVQWINNELYLTDETLRRVTKYNFIHGEWSDSIESMISELLDFIEDRESGFIASPAGMLNSERVLITARELRNQNIQPESRIQYFSAGIHGEMDAEKILV